MTTNLDFTARTSLRLAVLASQGAPEGAEWFAWPTASAALDRAQGALFIACDPEPSPDDWDALCTLIELAGFQNGTDRFPCDPGEPTEILGLCAWTLALGATVS